MQCFNWARNALKATAQVRAYNTSGPAGQEHDPSAYGPQADAGGQRRSVAGSGGGHDAGDEGDGRGGDGVSVVRGGEDEVEKMKEIHAEREEHAKIHEEVTRMRKSMEEMRAELERGKDELAATLDELKTAQAERQEKELELEQVSEELSKTRKNMMETEANEERSREELAARSQAHAYNDSAACHELMRVRGRNRV